jgi:hypothetical protein
LSCMFASQSRCPDAMSESADSGAARHRSHCDLKS